MLALAQFATLALCLAGVLGKPSPKPTTLKAAAKPRYFAAALAAGHLYNTSDPTFAQLAASEFNGATPENEMKWEIIEPFQDVFNFTQGERVLSWAEKHSFVFRGHTLVWHSQLAPFVAKLTGAALEKAMKSHVTTVMSHYGSRIYAWDVVNEAFEEDGTFRVSPFYTQLGEGFIETAFRTARATRTGAKLYINDYNVEGINPKSTALYNVARKLKAKGLLDGVGLQSHFIVGTLPKDLKKNIQRFAALGLDVAITELDIRADTPLNATTIAQHAKDYAYVVDSCQAVSRCVGITTWGITDRYSWIPGVFPGQDYGLLWDDNYKKKPAYTSTLKALSS